MMSSDEALSLLRHKYPTDVPNRDQTWIGDVVVEVANGDISGAYEKLERKSNDKNNRYRFWNLVGHGYYFTCTASYTSIGANKVDMERTLTRLFSQNAIMGLTLVQVVHHSTLMMYS